ncbi:MAG: hypothetical protein VW080_00555 [Flavobacteriaceae bacterium]
MESYAEWGYLGLFLASFLAATILPMSSEIVLSLLIANHYNLAMCLGVATLGNWLGGMTSYGLGRLGKWGFLHKYFKITRKKIRSFKTKIDRYGSIMAFFCWLPILGDPLAVGLGFFKTKITSVAFWMFWGKLIRYGVWGGITYWGINA